MYLKSGILVLFLIIVQNTVVAGPGTCGAPQKGEFLEDFHGSHSYVSYDINPKYLKSDSLVYQDRFCTKNGSGIISQIISNNQKEDILIEVADGNIVVQLIQNEDVKPECIFTLNKNVGYGGNYLIKTEFKGKQLNITLFSLYTEVYSLSVADISTCLKADFSSFTFLQKGGENIDVLLHNETKTHMKPLHRGKPHLYGDFDGCIGDSMLNGIPVVKAGIQKEKHDIDPSCTHNFGPECTDVCATSYIPSTGKNCRCPKESEINDFGLCVRSCNCITCQNGGTCSVKSASNAICKCSPYYEGRYCEKKIDSCLRFICLNGGSCSVLPNGPSCHCPPNFSGIRCEESIIPEDPCEVLKCQNNSTCERNNTQEENYVCHCLSGYHGDRCEYQEKSPAETQWPEWKIAVVSVAGVALVGIVIAAIFLLRWYDGRKQQDESQQGKENPAASP